jgi:hypothetical protein
MTSWVCTVLQVAVRERARYGGTGGSTYEGWSRQGMVSMHSLEEEWLTRIPWSSEATSERQTRRPDNEPGLGLYPMVFLPGPVLAALSQAPKHTK